MPSTWSYYTQFRFGWSSSVIGASLAMAGLIMATSQATLLRLVVPRIGERRAAITGLVIATLGSIGYATATEGWMMFAWLGTWIFGAMVMPTTHAYMSHRVDPDAQGELQGAVASLHSLASIVGPPLMTQLFSRFSAADAPVHFPGAAFIAASCLTVACWLVYVLATRERSAAADAAA